MLRVRRINGPIIIVAIAMLAWAVLGGLATVYVLRAHATTHVHTAECWDH